MTPTHELAQVLTLEAIDDDIWRGDTPPDRTGRVYGGQVAAQSLMAAYKSLEGRTCVSLHAYFVRGGDPKLPILYHVERVRDGGSFSVRRVAAVQDGHQIFNLAATFQVPEKGLEHQTPMPVVPGPEGLKNEDELRAELPEQNEWSRHIWPIEVRPCDPSPREPVKQDPVLDVWMRSRQPIGPDIATQQAVLVYASDMTLLDPSLRPHGIPWNGGLQVASLDHAIWFHHDTDFNQWHLFHQDSPVSAGGRGFNRGSFYSQDGRLVASASQDALIRYRQPKKS